MKAAPNTASDFIDRYVLLLSGLTDAPKEFLEASALFLLSTEIGRKWIFRSTPEMSLVPNSGISGKILNLWFIIMGKSRVSRKTSGAVNKVKVLLKGVSPDQLIASIFTPEALIDELSSRSKRKGEAVAAWVSDEIIQFFSQVSKNNSYMATADDLLSTLYDGSDYTRQTKKAGKEEVKNPYLTTFLASTLTLPHYFTKEMVEKGFLNRFIHVIGERKERKRLATRPLSTEESKEVQYIIEMLQALFNRDDTIVLDFDIDSKMAYDNFEGAIEDKIENENLGIREGYYGNLPNFVIRLACIHRISRLTPSQITAYNAPELLVDMEDIDWAIAYADARISDFNKVIEIMQEPTVGRGAGIQQPIDRVLGLILGAGDSGIQRSVIDKKSRLPAATIQKCLQQLEAQQKIEHIVKDTGGRPAIFYKEKRT